ncbi:MAG: hypothetical protein K2Q18_09690 [Bdellovibrionales bacterium]|nr:hypothetical protein [Bdellovibrionales bacterium]
MKILFLLMFIFLISGCAKPTSSKKPESSPPGIAENIHLGESSTEDIKKELGEPVATHKSEDPNNDIEQLDYQDKGSYRIVSEKLESFFRNPISEEESRIQFWRQKWKDQVVHEEEVKVSVKSHSLKLYQLIDKKSNTTVIFEGETGEVKRIVHYE